MIKTEDIIKDGNRFMFRGRTYKFSAYCYEPSFEFVAEDADIKPLDYFSCGVNAPILEEFSVVEQGGEAS